MADPQDQLKSWLQDRLKEKGPGGCGELAAALGVSGDALRRMKNRDGLKETRRIDAHHIPIMAAFFGRWPPGFEAMQDEQDAEALAAAAKAAGRGRRGGKARKSNAQAATKDVVVQGVAGPVTVIDKSVNVIGDESTVAGHAPATPMPGAAELMGDINMAIAAVFRAAKRKAPALNELGRLAYDRHVQIVAACRSPAEYPHAIEIMKLRLRQELDGEADAVAN